MRIPICILLSNRIPDTCTHAHTHTHTSQPLIGTRRQTPPQRLAADKKSPYSHKLKLSTSSSAAAHLTRQAKNLDIFLRGGLQGGNEDMAIVQDLHLDKLWGESESEGEPARKSSFRYESDDLALAQNEAMHPVAPIDLKPRDVPAGALFRTLMPLPSGLKIDPGTGAIYGTPERVTSRLVSGLPDMQTWTVVLSAAPSSMGASPQHAWSAPPSRPLSSRPISAQSGWSAASSYASTASPRSLWLSPGNQGRLAGLSEAMICSTRSDSMILNPEP